MLLITDLKAGAGSFRLDIPQLSVPDGGYFVLMGHSGAGKSFFCELISGFRKPDSGRILLYEKDISHSLPEKREISLVHQEHCLFRNMNVFENVAFGLRCRGVKGDNLKKEVEEVLDRLKISHLKNRSVLELSGGEKQRTAIARAVAVRPKLLIMDEPLNSLDPSGKNELMGELASLKGIFNHVTIHVCHDISEAVCLADKIGLLHNGRILQNLPPDQFLKKPLSIEAARVLGLEGICRITDRKNGLLILEGGMVISSADVSAEYCILHPELLELNDFSENSIKGTVISEKTDGFITTVTIDCGTVIRVKFFCSGKHEYSCGKSVSVRIPSEAVHLI